MLKGGNYNCYRQRPNDWRVAAKDELTGLDYSSEDGGGVDGRAVPASVTELVLTLIDGVHRPGLDRVHHVDVSPADLALLLDQPTELVAFFLLTHVVHCRDGRYRPAIDTTLAWLDPVSDSKSNPLRL